MSKDRLIPKQVADRNGKITTVWVRPDSRIAQTNYKIPPAMPMFSGNLDESDPQEIETDFALPVEVDDSGVYLDGTYFEYDAQPVSHHRIRANRDFDLTLLRSIAQQEAVYFKKPSNMSFQRICRIDTGDYENDIYISMYGNPGRWEPKKRVEGMVSVHRTEEDAQDSITKWFNE